MELKSPHKLRFFLIVIGLLAFLETVTNQQQLKTSAVATSSQSFIRIMPLGDSITHGVKDGSSDPQNIMAGYRYFLYKKLKANGYLVDFVGTLQSGPTDLEDRDNEGHNGYGIGLLSSPAVSWVYENIEQWTTLSQPTIYLIMLGTNDLAQPVAVPDIPTAPDRLGSLIDKISQLSPQSQLIVATIPPTSQPFAAFIPPYNNGLITQVNQKRAEGKKVRLVNVNSTLTLNDLSDTVHPNDTGYQKIADAWYGELIKIIPKGVSDINADEATNLLDYTILFENYQKSPPPDLRADLNQDGTVNILDYVILFEHYGS